GPVVSRPCGEPGPIVRRAPLCAGPHCAPGKSRERSMAREFPLTEHVAMSTRHTTFYLSCGPAGAPLMIFVHGWPELSLSWRHQLPCFASLGFRAIAPDMRGYGRSHIYRSHEDYRLEVIVEDMLELLDALGADKAVWV